MGEVREETWEERRAPENSRGDDMEESTIVEEQIKQFHQ